MQINTSVSLFIQLAKLQAILNRRFDSGLGGISLSEFIILLELSQAEDTKLKRIELSGKVGLTASGITRLLLPMEKVGLVKRLADPTDARASYVVLASGGKTKMEETIERAELLAADLTKQIGKEAVKDTLKTVGALVDQTK